MSYRNDRTDVPQALRREVLGRDGHHCAMQLPGICTGDATEVDHIIPDYLGGKTVSENLRGVCHDCHALKSRHERETALKHRAARRRLPRDTHPSQALKPPQDRA